MANEQKHELVIYRRAGMVEVDRIFGESDEECLDKASDQWSDSKYAWKWADGSGAQ